MIKVENLSKYYKNNDNCDWVIRNLNFSINDPSFVSIVGRSGSGKTTLLKMLGGLLKPSEGKVYINGESIYDMKENQLADFRSKNIGFVFQDFFLEEMFTVSQNIEIALMISGAKAKERTMQIENALESVGMSDKKNQYVRQLSGGEKQRASLARAIINNPKIIFADEPCGNLDSENSKTVMSLLRKQVEHGKTVIMVTHNKSDAAMTDEVITILDGRIVDSHGKREIKI